MSPFGAGSGSLPQHTNSGMTRNILPTNSRTNVEDRYSDGLLPRSSQPYPVLTAASINSGPSGSLSRENMIWQPQKASNIGSVENPIVID